MHSSIDARALTDYDMQVQVTCGVTQPIRNVQRRVNERAFKTIQLPPPRPLQTPDKCVHSYAESCVYTSGNDVSL